MQKSLLTIFNINDDFKKKKLQMAMDENFLNFIKDIYFKNPQL